MEPASKVSVPAKVVNRSLSRAPARVTVPIAWYPMLAAVAIVDKPEATQVLEPIRAIVIIPEKPNAALPTEAIKPLFAINVVDELDHADDAYPVV